MAGTKAVVFLCIGFFSLGLFGCQGGMNDVLNEVARELEANQGLRRSDIVAGLKEALKVGAANAIDLTSQLNGYYTHPRIKIPLPEDIRKVQNLLKMAGLGTQVKAFEKSMNRAPERASPEAKALFFNAIRQMRFADARRILNGRENEATLYFKSKTYDALTARFKPLVHEAMSEVGVTRYYQQLESTIHSLPVRGLLDFNLDEYVTSRALDGLFYVLAQEEAKIRQDPAARVTEILRKVFGSAR